MDAEKPEQSACAKKRAAKKAVKKLKDRAASSCGGGPGGGRQPKPKAIMDRRPGGGKAGGKDRNRAAGPVFPDGVIRQTKDGKRAPPSTRALAHWPSASLHTSAGTASRQPIRATIILGDWELRQFSFPTRPRGFCRCRRPVIVGHRFLRKLLVTCGRAMISTSCAIVGFLQQL